MSEAEGDLFYYPLRMFPVLFCSLDFWKKK